MRTHTHKCSPTHPHADSTHTHEHREHPCFQCSEKLRASQGGGRAEEWVDGPGLCSAGYGGPEMPPKQQGPQSAPKGPLGQRGEARVAPALSQEGPGGFCSTAEWGALEEVDAARPLLPRQAQDMVLFESESKKRSQTFWHTTMWDQGQSRHSRRGRAAFAGSGGLVPGAMGRHWAGLLRRETATGWGSVDQPARPRQGNPALRDPCILASHNTTLFLRPKTLEDVWVYFHDFSVSKNSKPHLSHHEVRINDSSARFMQKETHTELPRSLDRPPSGATVCRHAAAAEGVCVGGAPAPVQRSPSKVKFVLDGRGNDTCIIASETPRRPHETQGTKRKLSLNDNDDLLPAQKGESLKN